MKQILTLALALVLVACAQQDISPTGSAMQGTPVNLRAEAYVQMCAREPNSVLCPQDISVTNSNADEVMRQVCQDGNSFFWCDPVDAQPATGTRIQRDPSYMQGEKVRVKAQAYQDMCARNPESVLCP
jgi:hypothetical protein